MVSSAEFVETTQIQDMLEKGRKERLKQCMPGTFEDLFEEKH